MRGSGGSGVARGEGRRRRQALTGGRIAASPPQVKAMLTLDPLKRISADDVLSHPWIKGGAPDTELGEAKKSLKKYQASRKLKKAALGIIAQNRISAMTAQMKELQVGGGRK